MGYFSIVMLLSVLFRGKASEKKQETLMEKQMQLNPVYSALFCDFAGATEEALDFRRVVLPRKMHHSQ